MCLLKSRDAPVRDSIPQLDAAVLAASHIHIGTRIVVNRTYGVGVLVLRIAGHKALEGVDIIQAEGGVLSADEDEVSRRVERDGAQHLCFLLGQRHQREWLMPQQPHPKEMWKTAADAKNP